MPPMPSFLGQWVGLYRDKLGSPSQQHHYILFVPKVRDVENNLTSFWDFLRTSALQRLILLGLRLLWTSWTLDIMETKSFLEKLGYEEYLWSRSFWLFAHQVCMTSHPKHRDLPDNRGSHLFRLLWLLFVAQTIKKETSTLSRPTG